MEFFGRNFHLPTLPPTTARLREQVREFISEELGEGRYVPICNSWMEGFSPEFSRRLGARGWIGYHWPKRYGGQEGSALDTFTINEELLAAGAPVAAHWSAARQNGPLLMRFGTPAQQRKFLPGIAAGEVYISAGLSEPDVGSDLASVRTRARECPGGWLLSGRKLWSSNAHRCQYMIVFCRTSPRDEVQRHRGLTQLIVDLKSPGVTIRPIRMLDGGHHFNEVTFDDVRVGRDMVIGTAGEAWRQVTSQLAFERSGPERFMSTFPLLQQVFHGIAEEPDSERSAIAGRLIARLMTLRSMSQAVASVIDAGQSPDLEAAFVKDLGTCFERDSVEAARELLRDAERLHGDLNLQKILMQVIQAAPTFTLRGGTTEVLRNIIAKRLIAR